jgi:hypothetical protein
LTPHFVLKARPLALSTEQLNALHEWKFNCGPAAVPKGDGTWSIAHSVELLGVEKLR